MAFSWFLKLASKCLDHFAWPLLALGYPLCASVQAIETDSHTETRDLISYWILLSLICLFEYAFTRLLQWFQFWSYIKLMIIFWLIIPDFGRASYVYNNLIRSCIFMKPKTVICRLNNYLRQFFVEKDNFLLHVETYIKENGTEALEKLIASKINDKRLQTEHKDIKGLEVIEKNEIPACKQDIPVVPNIEPSQKTSSAIVETKEIQGKDTAGGELPQSSTHKEVQKEWTCALCQIRTTSEKTLNIHLLGKKHRATCEALKAKNQPKVVMDHKVQEQKMNLSEPIRMDNSKLKCEVCNVSVLSEVDMVSHLKGRKHLAKINK